MSVTAALSHLVNGSNVDPAWTEGAVQTYIATARHHAAGLRRLR